MTIFSVHKIPRLVAVGESPDIYCDKLEFTLAFDLVENLIVEAIDGIAVNSKTTYEYDAGGKRIAGHEEGVNYMGEFTRDYTYEYNTDGKLVKKIWNWSNGTVSTTDYEYDVDGNLIKEVYTEGDWIETTEYTYASLN